MTVKSILLSKTAWVAIITFVMGLIALIENIFPNQEWIAYSVMAKAILDLLLRLITTQPVSVVGKISPPKITG